jgi:hypothetical protein
MPADQATGQDHVRQTIVRTGSRPRAYSFVQLAFESKGIAVGTVAHTAPGQAPAVSVRQSFPSGLPPSLRITASDGSAPDLAFVPGQPVVLFLSKIEGDTAVLLGNGDAGKWPRSQPDWLFTAGHITGAPEVIQVVDLLFQTAAKSACEERAEMLVNQLSSAGTLGEIAAVEYAADTSRWKDAKAVSDFDYAAARLAVAERFMTEAPAADPAIQYGILQLLSGAPLSVAVPYAIEHLNGNDAAERDTAFSSLQTLALPYTRDTFGYRSASPPQDRAPSIQQWRNWWLGIRAERMRVEVPAMLAGLDASSVIRRQIANWSLRLVSGREVGYDALESKERRDSAAHRWRVWWEEAFR